MAASGSLRMALGHRAMAKKFNDTQAPIVQPEPVSPEATRAKEGTGPGGHPLPTHQRRRSSLTAESSLQMAEEMIILERDAAEQEEAYAAVRAASSGMTGMAAFTSGNTSVASPSSSTSSCCAFSSSSAFCSSSAYSSATSSRTHSRNSHCCDDSSRASPALPELPSFLDAKERQYRGVGGGRGMEGGEEEELGEQEEEERRQYETLLSGGGMFEMDVVGASESPSPSQRAALSTLYGLHAAAAALAEEKEEEGKEGETEDEGEEEEQEGEISGVVKRMLANHYLADRPELKRYDSADAALEEARSGGEGGKKGKKGGKHHQHKYSATSPLSSHLKSELQLEASGATLAPTVLQVPPRTHSRRRSSEGFVEIQGLEINSPDSQQQQQHHHHHHHHAVSKEEEEVVQQRVLPQLSRFDSGDYFMQEEARARVAAGNAAAIERPRAIQAQGEEEGDEQKGHKATASSLLQQRGLSHLR